MKNVTKKFILAIFFAIHLFLLTGTNKAYAAVFNCNIGDPPTLQDIACPVTAALNLFIVSVGFVFVGVLFYGSIKYSLSEGDSKAIEGAKKTLTWGVIGFVAVVATVSLLNIVLSIFGASPQGTLAGLLEDIVLFLSNNQGWFD